MPKEKEGYRDNLEGLLNFLENKYGDSRHVMTQRDMCEYAGRSQKFILKHYGIGRGGMTAETLARKLC